MNAFVKTSLMICVAGLGTASTAMAQSCPPTGQYNANYGYSNYGYGANGLLTQNQNAICGPNGCVVPNSGTVGQPYFQTPAAPSQGSGLFGGALNFLNPFAAPQRSPSYPYGNQMQYQTPQYQTYPANLTSQQQVNYGISQLPQWEQMAALQQRVCPISGELLGSRGRPVRAVVNGQSVFVCCEECARIASRGGSFGTPDRTRQPTNLQPWMNPQPFNNGLVLN